MFEAFLLSHHCLLCEINRRRRQHLLGSGIPDQIPGYSMSFDYICFTEQTVFDAVAFYFFCCNITGAVKVLLVKDKSAENLILCVHVVETWLGQYGHTLVQLRQDAGSTENCTALQTSLGHIADENSSAAATKHQQANPEEITIQPFMQQFRILLGSS